VPLTSRNDAYRSALITWRTTSGL